MSDKIHLRLGRIHLSTSERSEQVLKWLQPRRNHALSLAFEIMLPREVPSIFFQVKSVHFFAPFRNVIHRTDFMFDIQSVVRTYRNKARMEMHKLVLGLCQIIQAGILQNLRADFFSVTSYT